MAVADWRQSLAEFKRFCFFFAAFKYLLNTPRSSTRTTAAVILFTRTAQHLTFRRRGTAGQQPPGLATRF